MKECVPSQTSFRFTSQPWALEDWRNAFTPESLGTSAKASDSRCAGGIGDAMEILVRRRDGQVVDERRVQDPEEVAEAVSSGITPFRRGQGEGGAEELDVVAFVRRPDPDAVVEVFGEIDQDAGEVAERPGGQAERVVGEVILRPGEYPPELLRDLGEIRIALTLVTPGVDAPNSPP